MRRLGGITSTVKHSLGVFFERKGRLSIFRENPCTPNFRATSSSGSSSASCTGSGSTTNSKLQASTPSRNREDAEDLPSFYPESDLRARPESPDSVPVLEDIRFASINTSPSPEVSSPVSNPTQAAANVRPVIPDVTGYIYPPALLSLFAEQYSCRELSIAEATASLDLLDATTFGNQVRAPCLIT